MRPPWTPFAPFMLRRSPSRWLAVASVSWMPHLLEHLAPENREDRVVVVFAVGEDHLHRPQRFDLDAAEQYALEVQPRRGLGDEGNTDAGVHEREHRVDLRNVVHDVGHDAVAVE